MALRFGPFELLPEAAELRKHGVRLQLQVQPYRVLQVLLERPGQVVSRDELIRALWPDGTHVDFERGLNGAVNRLRQVLSDSAEQPRYIETIPKRGYRFIGQVEAPPAPPRQTDPPAPHTSGITPRRVWFAAALLILVAAAASGLLRNRTVKPVGAEAPSSVPLTSYLGNERRPSLSPDGRFVAFDWDQQTGEHRIFIQQIGAAEPVRLTKAEEVEFNPAWSPDGREIAFYRVKPPQRIGVYVTPAVGGVEREVFEFTPWWPQPDLNRTVCTNMLAWTPDGKGLAVVASEVEPAGLGLVFVALDRGKHRWLIPPPGWNFVLHPAFSPDGRSLAFVQNVALMTGDVYVAPFDASTMSLGQPRRLTELSRMMGGVTWMPDGESLVISAGNNTQMNLYRIEVDGGKPPAPLLLAGHSAIQPMVNAAGSLVFTNFIRDSNIWRHELPIAGAKLSPAVRFIASSATDLGARYSPDGTRIAFASTRSGAYQIWTCDSRDGERCIQVTHEFTGKHLSRPAWSPDGRWIVFESTEAGSFDAWVVPAAGGKSRRLTNPPADDLNPSFSKDGQHVYVGSARTGRSEIWRLPVAGGGAVQITESGGRRAHEWRGGEWLIYSRSAGEGVQQETLWKKSLREPHAEVLLLESVFADRWDLSGDLVWYVRLSGSAQELRRFNLRTSSDVPVGPVSFPLSPPFATTISPDGRYLLFSRYDHENSDVIWIKEFRW